MKIALVHDHLMQLGGAERVLEALSQIYPDAKIYTLFANNKVVSRLFDPIRVETSSLNQVPFVNLFYRALLPLMPRAIESLDFSDYDVVISSASSFAKGIRLRPGGVHICYCHTPTRWLWLSPTDYIDALPYPSFFKRLIEWSLPRLKEWDKNASTRVDYFIANSSEVSKRIEKYYNRSSSVIYPPLTLKVLPRTHVNAFFLTGGRLVSYKRFDTVVDAFSRLRLPLIVFGTGPDLRRLKAKAGRNIKFIGKISDDELAKYYSQAKAFIHPQFEDFGITATEAMASGCPVIAYGEGGAAETVVHGETGILYEEQSWEALADAVVRFDPTSFDVETVEKRGKSFSIKEFEARIKEFVNSKYASLG